MKRLTHTPGPWKARINEPLPSGRGVYFPSVLLDPNRLDRYYLIINECTGDGGMEECNANARLIAAAPDLLAALKRAHLGECPTVRVDGTCEGCFMADAIAKAEPITGDRR